MKQAQLLKDQMCLLLFPQVANEKCLLPTKLVQQNHISTAPRNTAMVEGVHFPQSRHIKVPAESRSNAVNVPPRDCCTLGWKQVWSLKHEQTLPTHSTFHFHFPRETLTTAWKGVVQAGYERYHPVLILSVSFLRSHLWNGRDISALIDVSINHISQHCALIGTKKVNSKSLGSPHPALRFNNF